MPKDEIKQGFVNEAANVAANSWPWVARSLNESIANIGYPVGMGLAPNPETTDRAARLICEYVACEVDERLNTRPPLTNEGELVEALKAFLWWADQQCPCTDEKPNPCTLCGASVENLEPCKAREAKFPRSILAKARAALEAASLVKGER
jgi:hypothetical protein